MGWRTAQALSGDETELGLDHSVRTERAPVMALAARENLELSRRAPRPAPAAARSNRRPRSPRASGCHRTVSVGVMSIFVDS
jgi:hypothetical protein